MGADGGSMFGLLALVADGLYMSTHAGAMLIAALVYTYGSTRAGPVGHSPVSHRRSGVNAMRNARGDITNWYGLLTDIHERKIGEERLRREELHLRSLVDAMLAMIWRATPGGEIDRWNRRRLSFIGKTWEEIDGKTLLSLVAPDERERVHSHWQQCVLEGSSYQDTYQNTGADGKLHWYLVRGEPFRDETGEILHWYGACTDIDDLKEAEVALRQREHQLREITETIPAMIWCTDADGQPTYYNRRMIEDTGADNRKLVTSGIRR